MVFYTDTIINPWAMMIIPIDTFMANYAMS